MSRSLKPVLGPSRERESCWLANFNAESMLSPLRPFSPRRRAFSKTEEGISREQSRRGPQLESRVVWTAT
jgi:hypothetical protein